jgi:cyclin D2
MEQLYATMEHFSTTTSPAIATKENNEENHLTLTEIRSVADPVLLTDSRVLANLLTRQDLLSVSFDYFKTVQTEVKPHMRKIVSDWMLEVTEEQQCQPEVFHLAVNYLDRYLSKVNVQKTQFQLIACVCMFLASKFKETCPLPAEHLVIYTDYSTSVQEIMVSLKVYYSQTIFL